MNSKFFWIGYCESSCRIWGVIPLERSPVYRESFMLGNRWKTHYQITRYAIISGKISKKLQIKFYDNPRINDSVTRMQNKGYTPVDVNKLTDVHFFFPNFKKNLQEAVDSAILHG